MTETSSENLEKDENEKIPDSVAKKKKDPVKILTRVVLILSILIFTWYVLSDRHTPYTDQGAIKGLAIPIAPRVSGYLTDINVNLHSRVKAGDMIFQLDPRPFEIALKTAEANLENTAQQVGARSATVKSSAANLGVARAQLDRAQRNYDRVQSVLEENPGALSQADKDRAETSLMQATERVTSAMANLERDQQQLGISGEKNAQFRASLAAVEQAQLDLEFSTIYAPANGIIDSYNVDLGFFSQSGQPLAMFISSTDIWIQADLKENNLANTKIGDKVEFALDLTPGEIYEGTVKSIGSGVTSGYSDRNDLPSVQNSKGWLRDPQRFPVIISIDDQEVRDMSRLGAQVDVVIYTGESTILNSIARFRIRLNSYLSFLR